MSVLVAYTHKNGCLMAHDSAAVGESIIFASSTAKAVKHAGGGIVGAVGSWRIINMLNEVKNENVTPQLVIEMLKGVKNEEDWSDSEVLFVSPGQPIVILQTNGFSTVTVQSPFMAVGAGGAYAIGYLAGQSNIELKTLKGAVATAAKWSPYVTMPAKVINV